MWFWCLIIALTVAVIAGSVIKQWFWASVVISIALWTVGIAVEIVMIWRRERGRTRQETTGAGAARSALGNASRRAEV